MDSRFYKKENVKYALYPQDTNVLDILLKALISNSKYKTIKLKLNNIIKELFLVEDKDIYYYSSGSKALENFLKILVKQKNIKNVYIPSFSCMELADAIVKSKCNIRIYDIEENLKPNIETLKQIKEDKEGVLILTSLFGKNTYSKEFIKVLQEMKMPIILDEAQSFPNTSIQLHNAIKKCGILISFGRSKPISAIGGGAIINKGIINDGLLKKSNINDRGYLKNVCSVFKARLKNKIQKIYKNKKQQKYGSLEELVLDKKEINEELQEITKLQIIIAYYRLKKYVKKYKDRKIDNINVRNLFGDKLLCDYNYLPIITNNENRYNLQFIIIQYI